ncbi:MAG: RidA family protein [Gulosibacter sp.]|uniref:RidA family protein n=1 Tax=Gulosibacter sp. TaxID=2817531 RepID=UPI003F923386
MPNALKLPAPLYRETQAGFVLFSGIVAEKSATTQTTNVSAELQEVFETLEQRLTGIGLAKSDVVFVRCYLSDFADFEVFNRAWAEFFGEDAPARCTVGVALLPPFRVEIEATAERPDAGNRRIPQIDRDLS